MMRTSILALIFCVACTGADELTHPGDLPHQSNAGVDWRDQMIYQIVVDRFADGDPNNDFNVQPTIPGQYHGGDWQGIIDHLDYLQSLGVTTLWISPVVKNTESDAGFASYHGYWTQDFLRPNAHFGDVSKLRELVDDAHARGMLVILDVVTNHVGQLFYYDINGNGQPDDWISGGGDWHTCTQVCDPPATANQCSPDEHVYCDKGKDYLERIIEWDPEYDSRGIQGWSSLGFSGPADIRFPDWPEQNRTPPPRPPSWLGWPDSKPWFDSPSWYHRRGRVYTWWHEGDYSRDFVREQETTGDFPGGLKDLDTDNPDVQEALSRSFEYWIEVADFDGFRIDTVKHIDRPELDLDNRGFWGVFLDRMRKKAHDLGKQNFFLFGEAFDGNDALIGSYTFPGHDAKGGFGRFDSVFYFSQYYRGVNPVFKQDAPTHNLECLYNSRMGRNTTDAFCQNNGYPAGPTFYNQPVAMPEDGGIGVAPQQVLVNFLDNHDLPRFLFYDTAGVSSTPVTEANLKAALFYNYTWDGIPCLYYGTEQLFHGGVDPKNREDMSLGNPDAGFPAWDQTNEAFLYVQALIKMRKDHVALRRGTVDIRWSTTQAGGRRDEGIFAFERVAPDEKALVVINASGQASETCAPANEGGTCMTTSFPVGTVLKDVSPDGGGKTFTVGAGGSIDVSVPPHSGRVLVK
ncbi:MAG TPA: alpha-amylase family glycosyl hydrolase [Kofleriaceae bacterium]|nr:alpha-amylase family glycosyl hydrolase [Kofleriaceae bacterium]